MPIISGAIEQILGKYHETLREYTQQLPMIHTIEDFGRYKESLTPLMRTVFSERLAGKSKNFQEAFDLTIASKYTQDDPATDTPEHIEQGRRELRGLLRDRNTLATVILGELIRCNKLSSKLLGEQHQQDILSVMQSGIIEYFDDVFLQWYEGAQIENHPTTVRHNKGDNPSYGGFQNGILVGYGAFTQKNINHAAIEKINDPHLKHYLKAIFQLLEHGIFDYQSWVDAEIYESKIWQDENNPLGFIAPMEDYIAGGILVEPEFVLFLRDLENHVPYDHFYGLAEKYYHDRYGMDQMTCTRVETVLESGDSTYGGFIGKAFPNDQALSQKEGNNIILKASSMKKTIESSYPLLARMLGTTPTPEDILYQELIKEVTYHEFGHSLFIKGHSHSLFEEAKATLFYYLKIYDEHLQLPYQEDRIREIVEFALLDSIRNIERIHQLQFQKYVILTEVVIAGLTQSELVEITPEKLIIHPTGENFGTFLNSMKTSLDTIKSLYQEGLNGEDGVLERYHQNALPLVEWIEKSIKKAH